MAVSETKCYKCSELCLKLIILNIALRRFQKFFNNIYIYKISRKGTEKWIDLNGTAEESSRKTGIFDREKEKMLQKHI